MLREILGITWTGRLATPPVLSPLQHHNFLSWYTQAISRKPLKRVTLLWLIPFLLHQPSAQWLGDQAK
jgi:hypothetical protein